MSLPRPMARLQMAGSNPKSRSTFSAIFVQAMAVRGALEDGFHRMGSPQTRAMAVFQLQTATGKLKAVMTPTTPRGCHCSCRRCWRRSLGMVRP